MKTNCFKVVALALMATSLPIIVLPVGFAPVSQAAPFVGRQKIAVAQRSDAISDNSSQLFKPGLVKTGVEQMAKRRGNDKSVCGNPRGMKLNVRAFFTITNSDDGFHDNEVETYGELLLNNWTIWMIDRKNAADKRKNSSMNAGDFTFKVMFNDPQTWRMAVSGFVADRDKGVLNNDDSMWNPRRQRRIIDIKSIYESGGQGGRNGIYQWHGDRDSESADLTLVISKVDDIY